MSFLNEQGLQHLWDRIKEFITSIVNESSNGDGFENCVTTITENNGVKTITQTYSDRTLVSTISTLSNGNKKIVEILTTNEDSTKTKTTIIDKTTGVITETIS